MKPDAAPFAGIEPYLEEKRRIIEGEIQQILEGEPDHPQGEIFAYCMGNGKRFRPILLMAAAEAFGLPGRQVIPAALSIEMIHNFSLVHDDLPCMDNDLERRGRPTCHARFGETEALLAGDGLLIFAFGVLTQNAEIPGIDPLSVVQVARLFSRSAGHLGMTGGQVMDMRFQKGGRITPEALMELHRKKTGALITASVLAGGMLAGASRDGLSSLKVYGDGIGLTFQIVDDLLDQDTDKTAVSFPGVFGQEESRRMAADATAQALKAIESLGERARPLGEIARLLLNRGR
jgi:geranylgeranyl diphosphate synthase type II